MKELELTYLAKYLPEGLNGSDSKEIVDIYIPKDAKHPVLRVRRNGDKYEITKKEPVKEGDASCQFEHTIKLSENEFRALEKLDGKVVKKCRYYYDYNGKTAEVDVFQGNLRGLVLVDVEFGDETEKDNFKMPDFCLADVTQEKFAAGGMLCGKLYADIEHELEKFGYKKQALV